MPRISPFKVALACGTAGAYVDVTSYASWAPGEGVAGSWGRQDQFRDTTPGAWSIYLDNYDGRFTPDTTNGILATPLTEGMGVSWQLGTRIIAGSILGFTMIEDNWGRIRVDVDDMLGDMGRNSINGTLFARSMVLGANPYLYWPFNENTPGGQTAYEQSGNQQLLLDPTFDYGGIPTFGVAPISYIGETQASIIRNQTFASGVAALFGGVPGGFSTINYPAGTMGTWGVWLTPTDVTSECMVRINLNGYFTPSSKSIDFGMTSGAFTMKMGNATPVVSSVPQTPFVPHYLQIVVTYSGSASIAGQFFIDGVSQGSATYVPGGSDPAGLSSNYLRTPARVYVYEPNPVTPDSRISHLSHTPAPVPEYVLGYGTEAGLLTATAIAAGVTLGTLPADLSLAPAAPTTGVASALAKLNDIIRSEQGYVDSVTAGTLTSPSPSIVVRARQRPTSVSYSFDAQTELSGQPDFIRDLTNLIAAETAQGPTTSTTYTDLTASARAGSSNSTDQVVLTQYIDQLGFAQDRINRGKNTALKILSFTVDALNTSTDRSADLLAIAFGDRVRIINIPSTVIGATTWDGWVIGRSEAQDRDQHKFTFYLQPVLPATAIYDTDLYANGGNNTISTTLTNVATSMVTASADGATWFERVAVPYTLQLELEQVTVTAAAAPSGGTQTLTITRAVNGTAAAAHAVGVVPEVISNSVYAF